MEPHEIIGVVLAGGQSRRMGGKDKSLVPLDGKPLLAHVVGRLHPQVSETILNANGDPARFAAFGLPVVADTLPGSCGPLAGIAAGLAWVAANRPELSWVVTVPGDTPFIPGDLVRRLAEAVTDGQAAVASSAEGVHPVVGLWPVASLGALQDALADGLRKARTWGEMQEAAEVFFPPARIGGQAVDPFFNVNRKEDLAAAEALLSKAGASA